VAGEENNGGYLAGALLALGCSGRIAPARLFQSGMAVTAAALALSGFTEDFAALIALRVLAGVGGAASWPQAWQALGALSLVSLLPAWWGARQIIDAPGAAKATGSMENMVVITPYFPIVRNDGASIDQRQRTKPCARMRVMQVGGGVSGECVSHGSAPVSCDGF